MATEEWIRKAISNGRLYEELPPRVRTLLPLSDWKVKVKGYCHQRGLRWGDSLAKTVCGEQEYYEDLIRFYRSSLRLFPYHLASYVCQVLRITPFKYYCDLLFSVMREEKSYDFIPNFTAADIVHVVGIGRNEYINLMNQCKARKLVWRVNKAVAREVLPTEPLDPRLEPWWIGHVVNLGEVEFQSLTPEELRTCRSIVAVNGQQVSSLNTRVLISLYKRELVYFDVPISPSDHVSIPPLEGFVSNKDTDTTGERGDPIEGLLYATFVASTERADVASLAEVLNVDLQQLQEAVSIACRLGFGTRLEAAEDVSDLQGVGTRTTNPFVLDLEEEETVASGEAGPGGGAKPDAAAGRDSGGAIAVVVDAEVTGLLMMGALSPGLKRHSVSLFEGGRVTGADSIAEMIRELHLSVDAGQGFEGEMARLSSYSSALARTLETVAATGNNLPVELLRKESLTGLAPAAAARVLAHSYLAVVPIAPLPYPPLPLSPLRPGPINYGTTVEGATPWLQLALYVALQQGPQGLVLPAGQRLWRLPACLAGCSQALVWPWAPAAVRAEAVPTLTDGAFLLAHLNETLTRTALLVQPLHLAPGELQMVDVPLPLVSPPDTTVTGVTAAGERVQVPPPPRLAPAMQALGLSKAVGYLRMLQVSRSMQQQEPQPSDHTGVLPANQAAVPAAAAVSVDPFGDLLDGFKGPQSQTALEQAGAAAQASAAQHSAAQPSAVESPAAAGSAGVAQSGSLPSGDAWVPLQLALGLPLVPEPLNELVCQNAAAVNFLSADSRATQEEGQLLLQRRLFELIAEYGACSNCLPSSGGGATAAGGAGPTYVDLPLRNLYFDGVDLWEVEMTECLQGVGMLCFD